MSRGYGTMSGPSEHEQDITGLCNSVGTNIQQIKSNTSAIEKTIRIIGTNQDNAQYRENALDAQKRTNELIGGTRNSLGELTRLARGDSKQRRLQVEKLTADFQAVLGKYSDGQQKLVTKMRKTLLVPEPETSNDGDTSQLVQQQQQLQYQLQIDDARMRESQMREIESVVVDVNGIMLQLADQITQQGQHIGSIEANIEQVQGNVEQGASELQKAATYQNKYRKKVLFLLILAIIVGIIVTAVVVSDVKN